MLKTCKILNLTERCMGKTSSAHITKLIGGYLLESKKQMIKDI